ncbi:MAG: NFACT RNA binding domain-containing protein, partial [Peptostreptococcales bacterium]
LLRKHLQGARISSIQQKDFERIVEIDVESFNELGYPSTKKLIVEIMGKHSNVIFVDPATGLILDSIKRVPSEINRFRQVLPGKEYLYPPDQNKLSPLLLDEELFMDRVQQTNASVIQFLYQSIQGFSPFIARQICELSGIDEDRLMHTLSDEMLSTIYFHLRTILDQIQSARYQPCLISNEGRIIDFHALSNPYLENYYEMHFDKSMSRITELFYDHKDNTIRLQQKYADLYKHVKNILSKLGTKKQKLTDELLLAESSDQYKLYGELINANIYRIKAGAEKVTLENYFDNNRSVEIELNPTKSISQNAQTYFNLYSKAKRTGIEKTKQLTETEKEIMYLDSVLQSIEGASSPGEIEEIRQELSESGYVKKRQEKLKGNKGQKKKDISKPLSFTSKDGFTILVGKNNTQNDLLTMKTASRNDIWLHTKDIPGSHVIIVKDNKEIPDTTLLEAASLAALHSKAKDSANVPVDYTAVKNVKKPKGAKPGMVIYDSFHTVYVNPMGR